jgi:predicted nucleotidyltransferase
MKTLDTIPLAEKDRDAVVQAAQSLRFELPVSKIFLFGSKARGQGDAYSDLDILVVLSCPVTTDVRDAVSEKLAQVNLEHDVVLSSVVVWEEDWTDGLIRYMPIYTEVQRDGCEV